MASWQSLGLHRSTARLCFEVVHDWRQGNRGRTVAILIGASLFVASLKVRASA